MSAENYMQTAVSSTSPTSTSRRKARALSVAQPSINPGSCEADFNTWQEIALEKEKMREIAREWKYHDPLNLDQERQSLASDGLDGVGFNSP